MCYNCLSILNGIVSEEKIKKLKTYFLGLTPNNRDLITVTKVSNAMCVDNKTAVKVILKCEKEGVLQRHFGVRCPNCGMLIKELETASLEGVFINECYSCDEEININENDVVILFKLVKIEIPFEYGQQEGQSIEDRASIVAQEDTLKEFQIMCKGINDYLEKERLKAYEEKIVDEKITRVHRKASGEAERNRKINITLNVLCVVIDIVVICFVYNKYGFSKLSLFTGFTGFIVPFICNYVLKEIFLTDIKRIEEKFLLED